MVQEKRNLPRKELNTQNDACRSSYDTLELPNKSAIEELIPTNRIIESDDFIKIFNPK